jgi:uridylate kinase
MYRRVVLKLSGESFADPDLSYGIDPLTVKRVATEIVEAHSGGV